VLFKIQKNKVKNKKSPLKLIIWDGSVASFSNPNHRPPLSWPYGHDPPLFNPFRHLLLPSTLHFKQITFYSPLDSSSYPSFHTNFELASFFIWKTASPSFFSPLSNLLFPTLEINYVLFKDLSFSLNPFFPF
jgi:hypothetical protein